MPSTSPIGIGACRWLLVPRTLGTCAFEVKRQCQTLQVSRSFLLRLRSRRWRARAAAAADAALADRIRAVHEEDAAYGGPRVTAELNDGVPPGGRVNRKRIARVMRDHGLAGRRVRRRVRTTVPDPADHKVPDLLRRDFTANASPRSV